MPRQTVVPPSLCRLAARQEGLVGVAQCREHGMTDRQVGALVRQGRWRRVMLGVLDTGIPSGRDDDPFDRRRRRGAILGPVAFRALSRRAWRRWCCTVSRVRPGRCSRR